MATGRRIHICTRALALTLLAAALGRAQSPILDELERRAREALDAIPHALTAAQADQTRPRLRRQLEASLGFRQLPPLDLQARVVGVVRRPGYRIEKLVYQSLPGTLVPAHLYVPDGLRGRAPAVLFYVGHWWPDGKTRPDFQAFCIRMARFGFVVLAWDPFGQGERGISSRDHRRVESLLVGVAQQGFAEYETRCALEYLLSRPEVDPKRIGMTGASGGGYNTWITSALDDRIAVAVPVVGTSDFFEQIHVTRPLDWYHASEHCHFVPGLIRYANNHEFLAMVAPRPLLIVSASQDQSFPVAGVRQVVEDGRALYRAYGAPGKISYFEDASSGHGYQQKKREAAYGWFLRWLMDKGDGQPVDEGPVETPPYDAPELRCFERNAPAGPGMIEAVRRLAVPPKRVVLPAMPATQGPAPACSGEKVLIAVGAPGDDALLEQAVQKGWQVCRADLPAPSQMGWAAAVSLLLGENYIQRRAADLYRVTESVRGPVALYARGPEASLAASYVVAWQKRLQWFVLREGMVTFRQFFERPKSLELSFRLKKDDKDRTTAFDREIPFAWVPFGALRQFDLPDLLARGKGMVVDPINGDWEPMPEAQARQLLPPNVEVRVGRMPTPPL